MKEFPKQNFQIRPSDRTLVNPSKNVDINGKFDLLRKTKWSSANTKLGFQGRNSRKTFLSDILSEVIWKSAVQHGFVIKTAVLFWTGIVDWNINIHRKFWKSIKNRNNQESNRCSQKLISKTNIYNDLENA